MGPQMNNAIKSSTTDTEKDVFAMYKCTVNRRNPDLNHFFHVYF